MAIPRTENTFKLPDLDENKTPEKPKSIRLGTPRGRVTASNARLLAFAGMFPGVDSESLSVLNRSQPSRISAGGELMTVRGTEQYLRKLYNLDALEKFRDAVSGVTSYGLSKLGIAYAHEFDYDMTHAASLDGISIERLKHYRMIARVAAQFASPAGFFKGSLGVEPVGLDQLISEHEMRAAFTPVQRQLVENKKQGKSNDYGKLRLELLKRALTDAQDGRIEWSNLLEAHPVLYTIGYPRRENSKLKYVHQPDLVINLDKDRKQKSQNILVEVELNKKSWDQYDSILATLKSELDKPYVYARAVYFTIGSGVETLLRKVDAAGDYKLFSSGKLTVLPICNRDGDPLRPANRVRVQTH
ncbi:hypothetical protein BI49514_02331 [Brevibacterium iodinum ATCC 49514]|uniref:Uncharacterized protein n=1 Tax=Brevibacterium iodinum ATCC 49514 TaxID=1255616 RepID=A0A2H1JTR3_9MICO|nr:hypothetical protein [Brevibacterium iodinum]SMX90714.1 hypothetical protein BI49514_02331 [Brevibacterium iodinum ATCC 49514]SUW12426.1 Uncharacterised protein [Brevibacterium iodinum]